MYLHNVKLSTFKEFALNFIGLMFFDDFLRIFIKIENIFSSKRLPEKKK